MSIIKAKFNTKTGVTTVDADGFIGKTCKDATKFLEEALGQVEGEELKDAYYLHQEQGEGVLNRMNNGG